NPDYYQLLAYTTALDVPEGLLIYCHDDGLAPEPIVVEYVGTRLFVRGIRLDGTPGDVDGQLRDLADWIVQRCSKRSGMPLSACRPAPYDLGVDVAGLHVVQGAAEWDTHSLRPRPDAGVTQWEPTANVWAGRACT